MLLIGLYLKQNKTKQNKTKQNKTKQNKKQNKQKKDFKRAKLRIQLCLYSSSSSSSSSFFFNWKCKWLKLNTPTRGLLVAHVDSLFWFRTRVCDFPRIWIPTRAMAGKKKKEKKNTCFSFFFCSPPFFFFFFFLIWVFAICMQTRTPMEKKKKEE